MSELKCDFCKKVIKKTSKKTVCTICGLTTCDKCSYKCGYFVQYLECNTGGDIVCDECFEENNEQD